MHAAAGHAQQRVVELLLNLGISANVADDSGYTPLHKAAWNPGPETARPLIARGADSGARSRHGYTPRQIGLEAAGKRLYGMERDGSTPDQMALQCEIDEELLRVLES